MQDLGIETLIGWLFPPTCMLCGAAGEQGRDLCAGCHGDLPANRNACARCARPFETLMPEGTLCGRCQKHPPPFERALAALRYEGPVPALVSDAKFRGRLNAARLLGQCLAERVSQSGPPQVDGLIAVPLHPRRLRERGYNQALEIARSAGRELVVPVDPGCCMRVLATPPQAGLDERARRRNIRGAFAVRGREVWPHVAIVDDVVTTGSTVAELSLALRRAGVLRVDVWAVARTP